MNLSETVKLLALMAAVDRRTIGDAEVMAWQGVLDDVAFPDAAEAVRRHYRDSEDYLMPVHVRRGAIVVADERSRPEAKWAAGQYGVPKGEPMPEIAGPIDDSNLPEGVKAKLRELLAERFPDASREKLKPRTVAWEREQRAYLRVRNGEANPHYRPGIRGHAAERVWVDEGVAGSWCDPIPGQDDPALAKWLAARGYSSYEEWATRGGEKPA